MGSLPMEILRAAGYEIQLSISTCMEYKGFARRVRGSQGLVTKYFQGLVLSDRDDAMVMEIASEYETVGPDRAASINAAQWITQGATERPFFLMVNLDPLQVRTGRCCR